MSKKKNKYPAYPESGWDYAVIHSAKIKLRPPNRLICIYCHEQCLSGKKIQHKEDCPAKNDDK